MSEYMDTIENGFRTLWIKYTDEELEKAWNTEGQGHKQACQGHPYCVVLPCSKKTALKLTRLFVEKVFAIPTCAHYDGETLALYCGDAGSNTERSLIKCYEQVVDFITHRNN